MNACDSPPHSEDTHSHNWYTLTLCGSNIRIHSHISSAYIRQRNDQQVFSVQVPKIVHAVSPEYGFVFILIYIPPPPSHFIYLPYISLPVTNHEFHLVK